MALKTKLWKVEANRLVANETAPLDSEDWLEDLLCKEIGVLDDDLLVIGRQVQGDDKIRLDILAVDRQGSLVVIELKKGRAERKIVAQALDYVSWVRWLPKEDLEEIAQDYLNKPLDKAFKCAFGEEPPENLNETQRVYIVASSINPATQRIVEYLEEQLFDLDIRAVTFSSFSGDGGEFVVGPLFVGDDVGVAADSETDTDSERSPSMFEVDGRKVSQKQGLPRKATNKQSVRVEEGLLVVEYEDGRKKKWELPEPEDKKAVRRVRQKARALARDCGAVDTQLGAIRNALNSKGYTVRS